MGIIEIEYRVLGNYRDLIFNNFQISKSKKAHCKDSYILVNKNILDRVRKIETLNQTKYFLNRKISLESFYLEPFNQPITKNQYEALLNRFYSIVDVEGTRETLTSKNLTFCIDNIIGLGEFTEFEKVAKTIKEAEIAENYMLSSLTELGFNKKGFKDIYPYLLLEKNGKR